MDCCLKKISLIICLISSHLQAQEVMLCMSYLVLLGSGNAKDVKNVELAFVIFIYICNNHFRIMLFCSSVIL